MPVFIAFLQKCQAKSESYPLKNSVRLISLFLKELNAEATENLKRKV